MLVTFLIVLISAGVLCCIILAGRILALFDNWVCTECHAQFGDHRYYRCPKCGSYEVENVG